MFQFFVIISNLQRKFDIINKINMKFNLFEFIVTTASNALDLVAGKIHFIYTDLINFFHAHKNKIE